MDVKFLAAGQRNQDDSRLDGWCSKKHLGGAQSLVYLSSGSEAFQYLIKKPMELFQCVASTCLHWSRPIHLSSLPLQMIPGWPQMGQSEWSWGLTLCWGRTYLLLGIMNGKECDPACWELKFYNLEKAGQGAEPVTKEGKNWDNCNQVSGALVICTQVSPILWTVSDMSQ